MKTQAAATGAFLVLAAFVDTPRTWIVDKGAGETLIIDLERRGGRAVITDVR